MAGRIHKARVFEGHKCTTGFHNALLDVVMPELSANTWKLLCVLIRQTAGWDREEQGASYATLMAGTGIKSKATIAACLLELETYRYPLISIKPGRQHEESKYTVNRDVEIDWIPQNFAQVRSSKNEPLSETSGSKNELLGGSKNEPLEQSSGSKNELSYRKESNYLKQEGGKEAPAPCFNVPVIWLDVFGEPIGFHAQETLEAEAFTDEELFREVLTTWKSNAYSKRNLTGMISRYHEKLSQKRDGKDLAICAPPPPAPPGLSPSERKQWVLDYYKNQPKAA